MSTRSPFESEMLEPVASLFASTHYHKALEVPLGLRRIDFAAISKTTREWITIELKVSDWKRALMQANINHIIADKTYVALWHKHIDAALKKRNWFEYYNVGLISVTEEGAKYILEAKNSSADRMKESNQKHAWRRLMELDARDVKRYGSAAFLSA